jgi:hypothetical protein
MTVNELITVLQTVPGDAPAGVLTVGPSGLIIDIDTAPVTGLVNGPHDLAALQRCASVPGLGNDQSTTNHECQTKVGRQPRQQTATLGLGPIGHLSHGVQLSGVDIRLGHDTHTASVSRVTA